MTAFTLSAPDNDGYMLANLPATLRCQTCGRNLDPEWVDPTFLMSERGLDASYTHDGYFIVSTRFRDVLGERGARYQLLDSEPSFFVLHPAKRIRFDPVRRRTTFENFCNECGRYHDIAGATPAFLRSPPPPDELRGTDIEFGGGDEQHPLLIVGPSLAEELEAAGLAGVNLRPVAE